MIFSDRSIARKRAVNLSSSWGLGLVQHQPSISVDRRSNNVKFKTTRMNINL
ncbi:MAG: hypothetical protein WBD58_03320 [Geitlerinemataceae cyanobacterium]